MEVLFITYEQGCIKILHDTRLRDNSIPKGGGGLQHSLRAEGYSVSVIGLGAR